ncbi:hypothetical protein ONZ45_g12944 [Pleurotus djamor]|nr:hypothetical protein ONZ45_g12944 [Pleurotus djamor]
METEDSSHHLKNPKSFIHDVVSKRASSLPIRLFDIGAGVFITCGEITRRVEFETRKKCYEYNPHFFSQNGTCEQRSLWEYGVAQFVEESTKFMILSHTWGSNESSYQDVMRGHRSLYEDVKFCGLRRTAHDYGCRYIWMDSVCIDQASSSEVNTSIRSMFKWYKGAHVCVVYLEEFHWETHPFDRWFQRGWTLQELLAPRRIIFFDKNWKRIFRHHSPYDITRDMEQEGHNLYHFNGSYPSPVASPGAHCFSVIPDTPWATLTSAMSPIQWVIHNTGISAKDITSYTPPPKHARKIFTYMWDRATKVDEDAAYCLIGLLDITLPIDYGEGADRALYRLQVTCAEHSDDRNIFLWDYKTTHPSQFNSMLPQNPFKIPFTMSRLSGVPTDQKIVSIEGEGLWKYARYMHGIDHTFAFTNGGLRISVILHDIITWGHLGFTIRGELDQSIHIRCQSPRCKTHTHRPNVPIPQHKLAILGTYSSSDGSTCAFPIVLEKMDDSKIPKYRRVPCMIASGTLPPLKFLLSRPPETVYIK